MNNLFVMAIGAGLAVGGLGAGLLWTTDVVDLGTNGSSNTAAAFTPLGEPLAIEDPAGDARDMSAGGPVGLVTCIAGAVVLGECLPPPDVAYDVGTPAPYFDILALRYAGETATDFALVLDIADIQDGFANAAELPGFHRMSYYGACWTPDPAYEDPWDCIWVDVMVHGGEVHTAATYNRFTESCNEWWWCTWTIPHEITFGAPAGISFTIPKAYSAWGGAEQRITMMGAYSGWYSTPEAFPMWHGGFTVHTPARHVHDHPFFVPGLFNAADWTDYPEIDIQMAPAVSAALYTSSAPLLQGFPGTHVEGSRYDVAELDLLAADLHEDGSDLVISYLVEGFEEMPDFDFDAGAVLGFGDEVWEIGLLKMGDRIHGYAGLCIMSECQEPNTVELPYEVTYGAPGVLSVRVPLELLGNPAPGTPTTLLMIAMMYSEGSVYWGHYDEALYGDVHSVFMVDGLYGGEPFVFGGGHQADLLATAPTHAH